MAKQFCRAKPNGSSVYFASKQILHFGFSGQNCDPCTLNSLDLFHDMTLCVFRLIQTFLTIFRSTASFQASVFSIVKHYTQTIYILICTYLFPIPLVYVATLACNINNRPVP